MDRHEARTIVITGASSGIGAATAEAFAARGARLVLAARNAEALESVAERCRSAGGEALVVPTDVTKSAAVADLAARAGSHLGTIDLWFGNVGIGAVGRFHEVPIEAHRRVVEANLIGHLNDAHAVLPIFIAQRRGIFVNMISIGAFLPAPLAVAYSASKFGLRGMSEALRSELSEYPDIHICGVYPTSSTHRPSVTRAIILEARSRSPVRSTRGRSRGRSSPSPIDRATASASVLRSAS